MKSIFNGIFISSRQLGSDISPRRTMCVMFFKYDSILFSSPLSFGQPRLQHIEPSFSDLLSTAHINLRSSQGPFCWTVLFNPSYDRFVFLIRPYPCGMFLSRELLPSMQALEYRPARNFAGHHLPAFFTVVVQCGSQGCVFIFRPQFFRILESRRLQLLGKRIQYVY